MSQIVQATPYLASVLMVLTDHVNGAPGKVLSVQIRRAGGVWYTPVSLVISDAGYGWYDVTLLPADTAFLGDLLIHAAAAGCDPSDEKYQVVPPTQPTTLDNDLQTTNALLQKLVAALCPKT